MWMAGGTEGTDSHRETGQQSKQRRRTIPLCSVALLLCCSVWTRSLCRLRCRWPHVDGRGDGGNGFTPRNGANRENNGEEQFLSALLCCSAALCGPVLSVASVAVGLMWMAGGTEGTDSDRETEKQSQSKSEGSTVNFQRCASTRGELRVGADSRVRPES
jgi:hypothetical protein